MHTMPFYSVSKITKCSIWPNCTSSLLESWIWLQQCRDLWELCWWWSGLFQFTEVTSAMMLQPTTWWGCLTKEHYWGHPRHAGGQWLYQIFCDENQWRFVFRGTQMYCIVQIFLQQPSDVCYLGCEGLIVQALIWQVAEQLTRIVQSGW